jgi:hypothetical protein
MRRYMRLEFAITVSPSSITTFPTVAVSRYLRRRGNS